MWKTRLKNMSGKDTRATLSFDDGSLIKLGERHEKLISFRLLRSAKKNENTDAGTLFLIVRYHASVTMAENQSHIHTENATTENDSDEGSSTLSEANPAVDTPKHTTHPISTHSNSHPETSNNSDTHSLRNAIEVLSDKFEQIESALTSLKEEVKAIKSTQNILLGEKTARKKKRSWIKS